MATQRIAPQRLTTLIFYATTDATDSRNRLTQQTDATYAPAFGSETTGESG